MPAGAKTTTRIPWLFAWWMNWTRVASVALARGVDVDLGRIHPGEGRCNRSGEERSALAGKGSEHTAESCEGGSSPGPLNRRGVRPARQGWPVPAPGRGDCGARPGQARRGPGVLPEVPGFEDEPDDLPAGDGQEGAAVAGPDRAFHGARDHHREPGEGTPESPSRAGRSTTMRGSRPQARSAAVCRGCRVLLRPSSLLTRGRPRIGRAETRERSGRRGWSSGLSRSRPRPPLFRRRSLWSRPGSLEGRGVGAADEEVGRKRRSLRGWPRQAPSRRGP